MWIDRRWLIAGVAASLLLNVFLIGVLAGRGGFTARSAPARPSVVANGALVPQQHVQALPAADKKTFNMAMRAHRDAIRDSRKAQRAARLAVEADIAAPTFDREKLAADFATLRQANVSSQESVHQALLQALAELSPQSRGTLVGHVRPEPGKEPSAPQ